MTGVMTRGRQDELPWLREDDPHARRAVRRLAERAGVTLHEIGPRVWGIWAPDTDAGDPFLSRPTYVGPWDRTKRRLVLLERERRKGLR